MEQVRVSFIIRSDLYQALRQEAFEKHISQREIIEDALEKYFNIGESEE